MKNNHNSSKKSHEKSRPNLFWRWLKGIWGSFSRFMRRSLNPSQGKRPSSVIHSRTHHAHISPLVGTSKFTNIQSLTVGELLSQVQWRSSSSKDSSSVNSLKDEINWD